MQISGLNQEFDAWDQYEGPDLQMLRNHICHSRVVCCAVQ